MIKFKKIWRKLSRDIIKNGRLVGVWKREAEGFTVVELLVAVGLFTIIISLAVGSYVRIMRGQRLMTELMGVPCHVAEDALLCVVRGTGVALENIDLYKRSIVKR